LFNESGFLTGEKETKEMLDAIQKATTIERLNSIDQSRAKGISTKKLTEDQAKHLADAIALKRSQLQPTSQTKAA
jgi:predicted DNA binding protein